MKLSIIVPVRNEEGAIAETLSHIIGLLTSNGIPFQIIVVDDGSADSTRDIVQRLSAADERIVVLENAGTRGYGMAVRLGLQQSSGDAVAIMMGDGSDAPSDLVCYWQKLQEGYDCVFGSRFIRGSRVLDYPANKLVLNRLANLFIRILFGFRYNDITNAFKCYRREAIDAMQPLISPHFNLTVEMPLKAIIRGYSYAVVPISWTNRKTGISKFKIKEMGSRYLFIVLYLWLERLLSRGDYHRVNTLPSAAQDTRQHV